MKNPFKKYSQINPQCENGFRQIANSVFKAIMSANFTVGEYKVILSILHHTWGFAKNYAEISASLISQDTNLHIRSVKRILKSLKSKKVIYIEKNGRINHRMSRINKVMFNKHFDTWEVEGLEKLTSSIGKQIQLMVTCETVNGDLQDTDNWTCESPIKENINKIKKENSQINKISEHTQAVHFYCDTYKTIFDVKYDFNKGKDAALLKSLLKTFGLKHLKNIIYDFLNSDDDWITDKGFTISILKTQANRIAQKITKTSIVNNEECDAPKGYDPFLATGKTPSQIQLENIKQQATCKLKE